MLQKTKVCVMLGCVDGYTVHYPSKVYFASILKANYT